MSDVTREDVLEAMLQQSASTIEFLHECLTNPPREGKNGGFVYSYPEQTLAWLKTIHGILPERDYCVHSKVTEGCQSCADGNRWREVMGVWEADNG